MKKLSYVLAALATIAIAAPAVAQEKAMDKPMMHHHMHHHMHMHHHYHHHHMMKPTMDKKIVDGWPLAGPFFFGTEFFRALINRRAFSIWARIAG